jgi:hypothetical protein
MGISETIKNELHSLCQKIAKLIGLKQGSVEIHCHKGKVAQMHVHDKSIKFEESKDGTR